mmetsp:Transcript_111430/g.315165  ORF Transcript_111430/g.315165 Transcript_111430/m.315165 type:complete len:201 (-) Transcript_111430:48-650(-)
MGAACTSPPQATAAFKGPYTVYYHGACKTFYGRAYPIILMLEHAGQKYTVETPDQAPSVGFAVPMIKFGSGAAVAQTSAICATLGAALGLEPADPVDKARALQITLDAADLVADLLSDKPAERIEKWLNVLEKNLEASNRGFFAGKSATFPDFAVFLSVVAHTNKGGEIKQPKLLAWLEQMKQLPSVKKLAESGIPVLSG